MSHYKQGINYGIGQQSTAQIDADLTFLRTHFDYFRGTYCEFDSPSLPYWLDIAERAKAKGFYTMQGITCPNSRTKDWFKFLQAFIDNAAWAASKGIVWGVNEEAYHNDDAILLDADAIKDLHTAARIAKLNNPSVKLSISLAGDGEVDKFIQTSGTGTPGRGAFDYICGNLYGTLAEFKANVDKLVNAYGGANVRITEFSTGRGFDPNYGTEASWKSDIQARYDYANTAGVQAIIFYTYYHNPELTAPPIVVNKWDMRTNPNNVSPATHHTAWDIFKKS